MKHYSWFEIIAVALFVSSAMGYIFLIVGEPIVELVTAWNPKESPSIVAMISASLGSFITILLVYWLESKGRF